jgi:aryl-alcohol dehydrogenase-like predicted oxidoreductase
MNYRTLGTSSLSISEIGFGCMSLGKDHDEDARIIHRAIELGINFFDTADLYDKGMNEIALGKAINGKRSQVIISTKVGNQWRADGSGWDWNPRKSYILDAVNKSLERLQIDYIDLYQLHGGTLDDPIDETIEAFEILKQQGKIRYYGISSIRPNVIREYVKRSSIVSVMMQYSLLDRRPEEACLELLKQNNIGVLARGSLAQGLLIDKPAKEYLGHSKEEVAKAAAAVHELSSHARTPAQTAIQFVLHNDAITSAVAGIRTMEQLLEVNGAASASVLTTTEMQRLNASAKSIMYEQHR